jgi:multiple sugar transport system substrate-binding protein
MLNSILIREVTVVRRLISMLVVLVMAVCLLSGCAQTDETNADVSKEVTETGDKTGEETGDKAAADESGQKEEAEPDKSSFSGQVEITVPAGDYMDFMKKQIKPYFEQEYPNVEVLVTPEGSTDILAARVAANDAPDIYVGVFGYMPAKFQQMGMLANIREMDGADELLGRINPVYINEVAGGVYYIPWNATTQLLIYNKELFKEAGLDPEKPPKTFDEYLQYAEAINKLPPRENGDKVYGNVFWNEALQWGGWYWTMLAHIYYNFNGGQYQLLNKYGTDIVFDKPEAGMKEFFEFAKKAQQFAPPTMEKNFFTRSIGMWLQFGYGWKTNLAEAKDQPMEIGVDVGVAPMPVRKEGDISWTTLDGRSLMIFKKNPQQDQLSWELIKFLMREDKNLEACKMLGQLPTLKELEDDPFFRLPENKPFVETAKNSLINEPFAYIEEITNELQRAYSLSVVESKVSIDEALKEAAEKSREIIKKMQ